MTNDLAEDYFKAEKRPAEEVYDYRNISFSSSDDTLVFLRDENTKDPIGWVVPNILTNEECSHLVQEAESFGIHSNHQTHTLRTSKRTSYYINQDLSDLIFPRIRSSLEENLRKHDNKTSDNTDSIETMTMSDGMGSLHHIHPNWRVIRYDPPHDSFPAHQDQMDSYHVKHPDGSKDFIVSSHTLLINITPNAEEISGGATRFYYPTSKDKPYKYAVDVHLPQGWGLVFRQLKLYHAGQLVVKGVKYVAQTGVLRSLPPHAILTPNVFRLAPGLSKYGQEKVKKNEYKVEARTDKGQYNYIYNNESLFV
eukprot:CAMPEP_0172493316 /NCGR_PEP_ID=MMETSP1066-20121228/24721_1 /TAXON_ID=671091 /ORGANISM="Coscinodiscus wailesii, Strain CCMP2513" /LENGTH=308 /DNA_ID=CAMNT_0013263417 /DNA_START=45 /DNA_END=971 /DNA_ORIENTATION=-